MRAAVAAVALAVLLAGPAARAGNDEDALMGNDAALTAGAIVAMTTESSALWYNPAGLAGVTRHEVEGSASAFVLRIRPIDRLIVTKLGDEQLVSDMESVELVSIGSSIANSWRLSDRFTIAVGVFLPESEKFTFRTGGERLFTGPSGETLRFEQQFSASVLLDRYHLGIGFGMQVHPRWRFGATLLGIYRTQSIESAVVGSAFTSDGAPVENLGFGISNAHFDLDAFGLQLAVGVQYRPHERWQLGLLLRTPALMFGELGHSDSVFGLYSTLSPQGDQSSYSSSFEDLESTGAALLLPFRVSLGVAHIWDTGWAELDVDLQLPIKEDSLDINRDFVWNVRAGFRYELEPDLRIGAGLFTDHSDTQKLDRVGQFDIDYYGLTFGFQMATHFDLGDEDKPEGMVMLSTLTIRYAVGFGQAGTLRFDPLQTASTEPGTSDVVFHELSLQIGSALAF